MDKYLDFRGTGLNLFEKKCNITSYSDANLLSTSACQHQSGESVSSLVFLHFSLTVVPIAFWVCGGIWSRKDRGWKEGCFSPCLGQWSAKTGRSAKFLVCCSSKALLPSGSSRWKLLECSDHFPEGEAGGMRRDVRSSERTKPHMHHCCLRASPGTLHMVDTQEWFIRFMNQC